MPASHEKLPNRNLSGPELASIIKKDVSNIIDRDGMFNNNISYARVSYEVRVSLHVDNPIYPMHVSTTQSRKASIQQVEADPQLMAIETAPLKEPLTQEEVVVSTERSRTISSPNASRVEHDMPLIHTVKDPQSGYVDKEINYSGDKPDPASVGNVSSDKDTTEEQRTAWGRPKKEKK